MAGRVSRVNTEFPEEETVQAVSSIIKAGGTALYPSDTVYGIIADSFNLDACEAVARMKGYPCVRPFIILIPDISSALTITARADAEKLMHKHWPGPVTLVFKASTTVPDWLVGSSGTVALRQPADPLSKAILNESGRFLITTSANTKGQPFPLTISDISSEISDSVDLILNGGPLPVRKPSKVLDCTGSTPVEVRS